MVEGPLGDAQVDGRHAARAAECRPQVVAHLVALVGENDRRAGVELDVDETIADFGDLFGQQRRGEIARHFIERPHPTFAAGGDLGLVAETGGQLADDEANAKHDGEGHQVLDIAYRERIARRHVEKIEGGDTEKRGHDRWTAAVAHSDQHDGEEKQHDDVGQVEDRMQRCGDGRGSGADRRALDVGLPRRMEALLDRLDQ